MELNEKQLEQVVGGAEAGASPLYRSGQILYSKWSSTKRIKIQDVIRAAEGIEYSCEMQKYDHVGDRFVPSRGKDKPMYWLTISEGVIFTEEDILKDYQTEQID